MGQSAAKNGVQLLDRAVLLLDLVASAGSDGASLKTLCELSALNKVTCHRILNSLVDHGFLNKIPGEKHYRLGTKLLILGVKAAKGPSLRNHFQPALERIRQQTGETVMLMARDKDESVCIDRFDGDFQMQTLTGSIGGFVPLGVGPGSLAILSFLPVDEREAIVARNIPRMGGYPMLNTDRIANWVVETAEQGFAIDTGELIPGIAGIAVPISVSGSGPIASLGLTLLSPRLTPELIQRHVALLRAEVAKIEPLLNPLDKRLSSPERVSVR
jgi:DNA-binding IclR family transcriptional regulator